MPTPTLVDPQKWPSEDLSKQYLWREISSSVLGAKPLEYRNLKGAGINVINAGASRVINYNFSTG